MPYWRVLGWLLLLGMPWFVWALDSTDVERFITVYPEVEQWSQAQGLQDVLLDTANDERLERPFSSVLHELDEAQRKQLVELLQGHGYRSSVQWAEQGDRIIAAMMAVEFRDQEQDLEQQMAQVEAMRNQIPPEMMQEMEYVLALARAMQRAADRATPQDIAVVEPYIDRISALGGT